MSSQASDPCPVTRVLIVDPLPATMPPASVALPPASNSPAVHTPMAIAPADPDKVLIWAVDAPAGATKPNILLLVPCA